MPHPAQLDLAEALAAARPRPEIEYADVPGSLDLAGVFDAVTARIGAVATPSADVVLLWTPHDRLVEATYVQHLQRDGTSSFDQHLGHALTRDLTYAPLLQRLHDLDGTSSVTCVSWSVSEQNLGQAVDAILSPLGSRIRTRVAAQLARPAAPRDFPSVRGAEVLQA